MRQSLFRILLPLLVTLDFTLVGAQSQTLEPCAVVSSVIAAQATDTSIPLPAEDVYQCLESVPIVKKHATDLLDGWAAFLEWQSDPTYKVNPPEGYLLPGFDYMQAISDLRDRVTSGNITRELDLQEGIKDIIFSSNDGHLYFQTDFDYVFGWHRHFSLASVSDDGLAVPQAWIASEISPLNNNSLTYTPSPIASIDDQDTVAYLSSEYAKAQRLQDPDALYNVQFFNPAPKAMNSRLAGFYSPMRYPGPSTTLTFANGTRQSYPNTAYTSFDFTGVVDGPTFYNRFCNATRKENAANNEASGPRKVDVRRRDVPSHGLIERQSSQPAAVWRSDDETFSAYIFPGSDESQHLAVISLNQFTDTNVTQIQGLLSQFLAGCRKLEVDHLVLDLSSNPGGSIILAYDIMKQLFPGLYPYFMRTLRAQPQLDLLGEAYTNLSIAILKQTDGNRSATLATTGLAVQDMTGYVDRNGNYFPDWPAFYGPVSNYDDQVTKMFTWDVSDTVFSAYYNSDVPQYYAVTGYGKNVPAPPRTFDPENIVILSDGACSSSCATLAHFLKWQAKVKSIVMGGRPQTGPMQHPGGVKGATLADKDGFVQAARKIAQSGWAPQSWAEKAKKTKLVELDQLSEYLSFRTPDHTSSDYIGVNLANAVLGNEAANGNPELYGDKEAVPLQYIYEAADCRMFYTVQTLFNQTALWQAAAGQAFGFGNTDPWSRCVEGSFGHESSLSGDKKLFNGGVPVNVTDFDPPNVGDGPVDVSAFNTQGNGLMELVKNGALTGAETGTVPVGQAQPSETGSASENENTGLKVGIESGFVMLVAVVIGLMMAV